MVKRGVIDEWFSVFGGEDHLSEVGNSCLMALLPVIYYWDLFEIFSTRFKISEESTQRVFTIHHLRAKHSQ